MRTVRELFDMLNGMRGQAMNQAGYGPPGMPPTWSYGDGGSYGEEGPYGDGGGYGQGASSGKRWIRDRRYESRSDDLGQGVADAVLGLAGNLAARKIGKRMRRVFEERIAPVLEAQAEKAQRDWDQSAADQDAIVERYPDLRGCLRDQVLFLAGGTQVVPISDIRLPVTLHQADALVARLR